MNMRGAKHRLRFGVGIAAILILVAAPFARHSAAQADEGFSLQVSPSPLVATVTPGVDATLDLQIRNTNTTSQALKMGLRSFSVDDTSGEVKLGKDVPAEIQSLVSFAAPTFSLAPGEIFTQHIYIHPTSTSGFSYNFATTIAQQNPPHASGGKTAIAGSVAVFTLISVDKSGAVRKFELASVSASKHTYEYLPVNILVKLKNTGNVNVQPTGTVYIQRHSSDTSPLAALPLNSSGGYVLPGTSRTFTASWNDGFPHYETTQTGDKTTRKLVWKGGIANLRIGRYVAKVVAIYDDGQRDVPVMAEVSFWVIPWRLLLAALAILILLIVGIVVLVRSFSRVVGATSRKLRRSTKAQKDE